MDQSGQSLSMGSDSMLGEVLERLRILVVGGIATGVVVAGIGSRLAMLVLRMTSPDRVRGATSDDGFTIGRVTLAGTYNLLLVGAVVGIIGAAAYRLVAPWLLGPLWLRRLTTAAGAAAVVGSMLVHPDGVDFTLLKPTWLAVGLFVALPAIFGAVIGMVVDAVARAGSWTSRGRARWALPAVLVACFPLTAVIVVMAAVVVTAWTLVRRSVVERRGASVAVVVVVRVAWMAAGLAGVLALIGDVEALY